ncbi:MAG: phosphopantothenoylcysteine decarboxylase [Verrucomicrobiota bacterium]|jgi:phosphopantothenoylcysteine decarboxylase/phosphopantothenate--cysteine ligase
MKCVVTAGPTYEELDEVRRLTNFSTGALGSGLADYLAGKGHEVELLTGYYSTCRPAARAQRRQVFTTTADLRRRLEALRSPDARAVFHAAAVSDFRFGKIWARTAAGELREVKSAKIATDQEGLLAELRATPKIIRELRGWFPKALLTGWKYELEGGRADALARGERQIEECQLDACVVNGRAYGEGFGLVRRDGGLAHLGDAEGLFAALEALIPVE